MATTKKPLAAALGAAFLATSIAPLVSAASNPFSAQQLSGGYDLANYDKPAGGKCPEGKCGEGKCGEGKCGEGKSCEGKCGEGKCGEGKCGGTDVKADSATDATDQASGSDTKAGGEGKCGEGKCGGK